MPVNDPSLLALCHRAVCENMHGLQYLIENRSYFHRSLLLLSLPVTLISIGVVAVFFLSFIYLKYILNFCTDEKGK